MRPDLENRIQDIWYGNSSLRWILLPFSWIYSAFVACRRFLYSSGLIKSRSAAAPVVIVGNITVGGTGKTPLTIWLARQLAARGYSPCIISRGYGGKPGPKPQEVTAESDPAIVGDEAILIARRSGCPVVVHPDRVAAAIRAVELGASVVVSDDGLQHYRLDRDYEIAVVDGTRGYGNGRLLPAGPLRESVSRLCAVDQVLVQQQVIGKSERSLRESVRSPIEFQLVASRICSLDDSDSKSIEEFSGARVHAVAGIGNPERFFRLLESHDIEAVRHPLPDHADIQPADLKFGDDLAVLLTEKDAVKCRWPDTANCWYIPVDVAVDDNEAGEFLDRVVKKISPDRQEKAEYG